MEFKKVAEGKMFSVSHSFRIVSLCLQVMVFSIIVSSCNQDIPESVGRDGKLKVANWNVQTFFDSVTIGNEYSEFVGSKRWCREAYIERLKRLCSVIVSIDADIFVMEEIENENVVYDISNFLAGQWDGDKVYTDACFAKEDGSSIGCAVLSRVPLEGLTVHSLDVRTEENDMPRMRPLMEVKAVAARGELVLIVNHWKSKSGGEEETEIWRNREEGILAELVRNAVSAGKSVLAVGDFNRDIRDFCLTSRKSVLLRFWKDGTLGDRGVEVFSPWFMSGNKLVHPGSYYYKDEWSRIDHFFSAGNAEIMDFYPAVEGEWCDSKTFVPNRYQIWDGTGYSDHLPVVAVVSY